MMPIFEGLEADSFDRRFSDRQLLIRIIRYFKQHAAKMLLLIGLISGRSLISTALVLTLAYGVDYLKPSTQLTTVGLIALAMVLMGMLEWTMQFGRISLINKVVGEVVLRLRRELFSALMLQDMAFYDKQSSGSLISRVTSDTQLFSQVITLALDLLSGLLTISCIVTLLFYLNADLALIAVLVLPISFGTAMGFRKLAQKITMQERRSIAYLSREVKESLTGIAVAKNYRQEQTFYNRFRQGNKQYFAISLRMGILFNSVYPALSMISGLATGLLVVMGGKMVMADGLSPAEWFLFLQGLTLLWQPLSNLASFWSQFQQGLSASERIFSLLEATPTVKQVNTRPTGRLKWAVSYRDMDFQYSDKEKVLSNFSLDIQPGETVALVGHTGSGKSSIINLLLRLYEFQKGSLTIDGTDIRCLDLEEVHQQIGIVTQVPALFSGTVRENICYTRPDASEAEIQRAVNAIDHGAWIHTFSRGLETPVGKSGSNISMGQRQLIALSRIFLQNPSILILDEATASVDPLTEVEIQKGLDVVFENRTSIVIAHRLSTVQKADRIILLSNGNILEQGSHDNLLHKEGHYAELYNTYFRHQEVAQTQAPEPVGI